MPTFVSVHQKKVFLNGLHKAILHLSRIPFQRNTHFHSPFLPNQGLMSAPVELTLALTNIWTNKVRTTDPGLQTAQGCVKQLSVVKTENNWTCVCISRLHMPLLTKYEPQSHRLVELLYWQVSSQASVESFVQTAPSKLVR